MLIFFQRSKHLTGSIYVKRFQYVTTDSTVYNIQAEAPYRAHKDNLGLFFVKGSNNAMIPLPLLVQPRIQQVRGLFVGSICSPPQPYRERSGPGYSSGQAMAILEEIASKHLPKNIGIEWSGLSYQEKTCKWSDSLHIGL